MKYSQTFPSTGFLSRITNLHSRITWSTLPDQHVLFGKNHRRTSIVHGGSPYIHVDCLSHDRTPSRLSLFCHGCICCVTRGQCVNLIRILNFVRQFIDFNGVEHWPTRHYSLFDFRWIFPQLGFGSIILHMAFLSLVVPIWQWSFDH